MRWMAWVVGGFLWLLGVSSCAHENDLAPSESTPILRGLDWLRRHQASDGRWGAASYSGVCKKEECKGSGEEWCDVGVTGLAILAFLGQQHPQERPAPEKRALDWLILQQDSSGLIGESEGKYIYNHAVSIIALCEAIVTLKMASLRGPAQKAVDFLVSAQNPRSGWRYTARSGDNDSSVTTWCVLALWSAEIAGLNVPPPSYEGAVRWFDAVTDDRGTTGYTNKGPYRGIPLRNDVFDVHPTLSAGACLARSILERRRMEPTGGALDILMVDLPRWTPLSIDSSYWFIGSAALCLCEGEGGQHWMKWKSSVQFALIPQQGREGCARGSWDPRIEKWTEYGGGRVYVTAMDLLTLELSDPECPGILKLKAGPSRSNR